MNNGQSDASTSTEDMKGRPLCLYYFTHPFGVLSPEPPRVAATFEASADGGGVVSVAGARYTVDLGAWFPTFPADMWAAPGMGGAGARLLPPLRVNRPPPTNVWTRPSGVGVGKRSLPPLPAAPHQPAAAAPQPRSRTPRPRTLALRRINRRRKVVKGGRGSAEGESRALRSVLRRLRDAWPGTKSSTCDSAQKSEVGLIDSRMLRRGGTADSPALTPRPGASPGLLRRRYSVPETVMRKYRLAQLNSEEVSPSSAETCSCSVLPAPRALRKDREIMRRSALMRRLHGRSCRACCCSGCECMRTTRSLDTSQSELRPSQIIKRSPISGRTSPKRLRLDSPTPCDSRVNLTSPSGEIALSVSSRYAQAFGVSSCTDSDMFVASSTSGSENNYATDMTCSTFQCSGTSSDVRPTKIVGDIENVSSYVHHEENFFAESSDTCSTSMCTAKETANSLDPNGILLKYKEDDLSREKLDTANAAMKNCNIMPFDRPLTVETTNYDILEIVVSETLNTVQKPSRNIEPIEKNKIFKSSLEKIKKGTDFRCANIDEYVSNILVESLNSLTDHIESMNASIGPSGKMSIIEKEIKVKLQNTGVNTIVHLSPTSNNQIIFGHEELCCSDEHRDNNDVPNNSASPAIRDDIQSQQTDCNQTSTDSLPPSLTIENYYSGNFTNVIQPDNVNKAVLQQIQKLFQDDIQNKEPDARTLKDCISHIEISNVDVYVDSNIASYSTTAEGTEKVEEIHTGPDDSEVISSVGTGNYYEDTRDNAVIPRFSAFPHTDSMEVNTSSSDDVEIIGSECTSLVDSLDDPNSPRSVMLRKSAKRCELVRSSIDVLDLLPENMSQSVCGNFRDKGESFFIRIKDDDCECDCEKKDIVVADHMPETIKQRLLKRHRKREMRMESARRSKVKQLRRELEKQHQSDLRKSRKKMETECVVVINTLLDDIIAKIAQDELKCMRIKQKSVMMVPSKSDETLSRNSWKKNLELNNNKEMLKNKTRSCSEGVNRSHCKTEKYQIRGKLSLQTYPPLTPEGHNTKRIYQKSEIHDGKKCIEILEILEYVNGSESSPETVISDDNQNVKHKKSRIPIPVTEKLISPNSSRGSISRTQSFHNRSEKNSTMNSPNSIHYTISDHCLAQTELPQFSASPPHTPRKVSISNCEPRARSNSLRFKRVFDVIPEERSSLSVDSPYSEQIHNRRASVPIITDKLLGVEKGINYKIFQASGEGLSQSHHIKLNSSTEKNIKETKSAGTSPMPPSGAHNSVLTQTRENAISSPLQRSAATSPIRNFAMSTQTPLPRRKSISTQQHQPLLQQQKSKINQAGAQTRAHPHLEQPQLQTQHQPRLTRHRVAPEPALRQRLIEGGGNRLRDVFTRRRSVSSLHHTSHAERLPRCVDGCETRVATVVGHGGESGAAAGVSSSSSSSESGGSLLCPLAPAWLQARRRRRRAAAAGSGQWAVTVAGSCPAALPADVEMRLRFPETQQPRSSIFQNSHASTARRRGPSLSPPAPRRAVRREVQTPDEPRRLTLTMKKEASDSSILASKSVKKSMDPLPDVETFRASRSKTKSSVKKAVVSDASRLLPTLLASGRRSYTDKGQ